MEVILRETIDNLGREGDIVSVKPGYGRNYLLPQQKAVIASEENKAIVEKNQATIAAKLQKAQKEAESLSKKISGANIEIAQLAGDDDRLFGSVNAADIAAKLAEKNIEVDKKQILLTEPIKTLGETSISVKVGFQMKTEVIVKVIPLKKEES